MADLIAGRNPVIEALKSGRPINKIVLARNIGLHSAVAEILNLAKSRKIPVEYVERPFIDQLSATSSHQGVIAYAAIKEFVALTDNALPILPLLAYHLIQRKFDLLRTRSHHLERSLSCCLAFSIN